MDTKTEYQVVRLSQHCPPSKAEARYQGISILIALALQVIYAVSASTSARARKQTTAGNSAVKCVPILLTLSLTRQETQRGNPSLCCTPQVLRYSFLFGVPQILGGKNIKFHWTVLQAELYCVLLYSVLCCSVFNGTTTVVKSLSKFDIVGSNLRGSPHSSCPTLLQTQYHRINRYVVIVAVV